MLALGACGTSDSTSRPNAAALNGSCHIPGGPGVQDWDNPVPGEQVSAMAMATTAVSFQPRTPDGFGPPTKILVVPPVNEAPKSVRGVMLLFDKEPYGRLAVSQSMYEGPAYFALWVQETAARSASVPCGPTSEATTIR
ncbi:MAG: hypothetical protein ACREV8_00170, partial [Gammaproteobacteria bacterium]